MKKRIPLVLIGLILSSALWAEEIMMPPLALSSAASNGLGGPHVAYTNDIYALFVNPAALQWVNQGSILELSFALVGPLDKLAKNGGKLSDSFKGIMNGGGGGDENPFEALTSITNNGKLPLGVDIRGPISVGYTANGFGLGLFSRIVVDARITGVDVDATAYADVMLPAGMSFNILRRVDHELSAGVALKPFVRILSTVEASAFDFFDSGDSGFLDDVSMPVLAGLGNDLGLMYRFKRNLAAGLTVGDIYTFGLAAGSIIGSPSSAVYRVPTSLNLGVAYTFRPVDFWERVPKALQSFYAAAMLDWRSMNNIFTWNDRLHRNPILDLGIGAELGFFNFLKLRFGLRDMLPMVGLGLEPALFKFNVALYGKELGAEPGVNSTMALDLSIALRLNTKKRNWPWSKPIIN